MRHDRLVWLAAALLLWGVWGDDKADKAEAVKEEYKRLNGTWQAVSAVDEGKEVPLREEKVTLTFEGDRYTAKRGERVTGEGVARIDPTTAPKSLDLLPTIAGARAKTIPGIYEVKGHTLRICFTLGGKTRPKAFESKGGSGHALATYERAKAR